MQDEEAKNKDLLRSVSNISLPNEICSMFRTQREIEDLNSVLSLRQSQYHRLVEKMDGEIERQMSIVNKNKMNRFLWKNFMNGLV